jgi:hypothetical protein
VLLTSSTVGPHQTAATELTSAFLAFHDGGFLLQSCYETLTVLLRAHFRVRIAQSKIEVVYFGVFMAKRKRKSLDEASFRCDLSATGRIRAYYLLEHLHTTSRIGQQAVSTVQTAMLTFSYGVLRVLSAIPEADTALIQITFFFSDSFKSCIRYFHCGLLQFL